MTSDPETEFPPLDRIDRLVQTRPAEALALTRRWLGGGAAAQPTAAAQPGAVMAWGAMARALFELGQIDSSVAVTRQALSMLSDAEPETVVAITMSGAAILAEAGLIDEALELLDSVETIERRGRVLMQRSYVLAHAGQLLDALEQVDLAEPLLVASGDDLGLLRLAIHRGVVQLQRGRLTDAEADFRLADDLAGTLGQTAMRAGIASNLGVLYGRRRDLRGALEQFDRARTIHAEVGQPGRMVAVTEIDRAEVLMHAGLVVDAVEAAETALRNVEPTGNRAAFGDSQLLLARAQLAAGSRRAARRTAAAAAATFLAAERREMVSHARLVEAHAALEAVTDEETGAPLLAEVEDLVGALAASGWHQLADELQLSRVRTAHRLGLDLAVAAEVEELRLGAFSERRDVALAGWYCEAIARAAAGTGAAALDACRAGLDLLDDIVAEAPTLGQRSASMRLGNDLSQLTIELAVRLGDADTVLAAAEGTRARALHEELSEQRRHRPLTVDGADQLRRELAARLGARVFVEWVVVGPTVWAVLFDSTGSRLVEVGATNSILRERDRLLVWLDLAASEPDASSRRAVRAAGLLDDLLIGPLDLPDRSGVVMAPVGLLHGIPWSGLPRLSGRSFVLVPNAQLWLEADRRPARPAQSVGLVVGPEIAGVEIERDAVERRHPDAAIASGPGATAATVSSMFAGLDLVHLAAHGTFRSDHPLLSTVRLVDGEATLYEVVPDRLHAGLVVLSSCEGGAQGTADGSEVLGLSAVLLARGAAAVLAPLTMVRDLECADFVAEVHSELSSGEPFACAVANVRERWLGDDDLSRWAVASSFTCFGSGAVSVAAT